MNTTEKYLAKVRPFLALNEEAVKQMADEQYRALREEIARTIGIGIERVDECRN